MKAIIQKELGLPTVEISDQKATIDGGDVLFTGIFQSTKHFVYTKKFQMCIFRQRILCWNLRTNESRWRPSSGSGFSRVSLHSC
jgi:hypothetical protein